MANNTDLRVRISADLADIKQGLGLLRGELAKVKAQSAQAFGTGNSNALVGSMRRLRTEVVGLVGAYASLAGGKMLAGIADEATRIRGRIREAKGEYEAILALANDTRTSLAGTTDLYARLERSTRGRVKGQEDLLAITKSVNQAIKLSYTGTQQGEAAVLQLGQALASGKLAGDEFRSISENAPRLMQAISDAVGRPIGELKNLAKEGKLTTDVIVQALLSQGRVLEEEYARVPVTIGDAFTQIRNSFVDYVGKADDASGASQRFAATLQDVARNLPQLLDPLLRAITLLIQNLDVLVVYIGTRLALSAIPAMMAAVNGLRAAIVAARAATLSWSVVLATLGGPVGMALAAIAAGLYMVYQRTNDAKQAAEEHTKALADNAALSRTSAAAALAEAQAKRIQAAATLQAARAALEEKRAKMQSANRAVTASGWGGGDAMFYAQGTAMRQARRDVTSAEREYKDWGDRLAKLAVEMQVPITASAVAAAGKVDLGEGEKKAKKAKKAIRGIIDENALLQDALKATLEELEARFERGELGIAQYYTAKRDLMLQAVDARIAEAQAEAKAATSTEQQTRALTEVVKLQRERALIGPATARAQAAAEKELTDQLELLRGKLADLNGGFGNEAAAKLKDEYEALLKKLGQSAEGADLAGKIFNIESARARIDAIQSKVQDVMARLRDGTTYLAAQEQVGGIGPAEGERQLFDLRQRSLEQLRALRQAMAAYLATQAAGSPEHAAAVAGLQQLDIEIAGVQASQQTFANAARDGAIQALSGFFTDLATGAKNFTDAFKSMVLNFVQGLARMAAEALAKRIIMSLFAPTPSANGNAFGGGGLLPGFAKGAAFALPGLMAFANGGAFTNQVFSDPTIFKFGSGDQFGVMGEAGPEAVMPLSRGPDGKLGVKSNGTGAGRPQRIVLVENQRDAEAMVRGSTGEDAVIMHIERNAGKIREILA